MKHVKPITLAAAAPSCVADVVTVMNSVFGFIVSLAKTKGKTAGARL